MTRVPEVVFENVSKFYGEVLGVNKVTLTIPPGVTSLVGPNGSGKTTLMNLISGLLRPTRGRRSPVEGGVHAPCLLSRQTRCGRRGTSALDNGHRHSLPGGC